MKSGEIRDVEVFCDIIQGGIDEAQINVDFSIPHFTYEGFTDPALDNCTADLSQLASGRVTLNMNQSTSADITADTVLAKVQLKAKQVSSQQTVAINASGTLKNDGVELLNPSFTSLNVTIDAPANQANIILQ